MIRGARRYRLLRAGVFLKMTYDALIIGFGPVGATLANLLARLGLHIGVVEAELDIYDKPRALTFDHEVMRIFQACGLALRIAEFTAPHPGTHYLGMDGRVIKKFESLPPPHPLAWPPTITFVQPQLEKVLRGGVAGNPAVDVMLGWRAVDFTQEDDGVTVTARDVASGEERVLRARTLLGCDGANSFVRKHLDIPLEDLGFDEWWMVVDVLLRAPVELPPRGIQYCWPSRPSTFVPGPGNLRRWEIKLLPGEDPEEFGRPENVTRQISRFVDLSCVEIWRSAVYRFHALLAERWRHGRVFLLGDACHQTPPFLGQGMCAGIRDAANLAWKLALVLRQGAPGTLLDSYALERRPHVRTLVATAKEFGRIIGELDVDAARIRDQTLRGQLERGEAETIRQRFIPNLTAGIIDCDPAARGAGTLFVQPKIRSGPTGARNGEVLLDDLLGMNFLIVSAQPEPQTWLTPESRILWQRLGAERLVIGSSQHAEVTDRPAEHHVRYLAQADDLFSGWMAQQDCAAVVVRPDRYVFGMASDAAQLNRLVAAVGRHLLGSG
jgi:3-(3-hydroxy-phenyl)propionate hydroxylase